VRHFLLFALAAALPAAILAEQPTQLRRFTPGESLSGVLVEYEIGPSHCGSLINRTTPVFEKYKANLERYPRSGRFFHFKTTPSHLVQIGFGVSASRVIGPEWISRTCYEVYFETDEPTCDYRLILRQLLVERFGLVTHVEHRPNLGLALTTPAGEPDRSASKVTECRRLRSASFSPLEQAIGAPGDLQVPLPGSEENAWARQEAIWPIWGGRSIFREGCRIGDLAAELEMILLVPVADRTTATGRYDFKIDLHRGMKVAAAAKQLRKKFSAELATDPEPTEVLVIDSAERIKRVHWSR